MPNEVWHPIMLSAMPNEVWLLCRGASYIVNSVDKYPLKKSKPCLCIRLAPPVPNRILSLAVCHNEQSASLLSSLELSHVLQYAPSFSLSAPCILLTLTRRLRVISNAYFDTPSLPKEPECPLRPYPYSPLQWDLFFNAFSINGSF